jgi:hypothetical protein
MERVAKAEGGGNDRGRSSTMNNAISQQSSIRSAAPAGVPDDGVVHVDQLAKDLF